MDHPDVDWWYKQNMLLVDPTRALASLRASLGQPAPPRRRLAASCGSTALVFAGLALFGSRTRRDLSGLVYLDLFRRAHGTAIVYEDGSARSCFRAYNRTTGEPVGA